MSIDGISGNTEAEFHCKPRPGCHMARCDPALPGFEDIPRRNEYPVTCIRNNPDNENDFVTRQDYDRLLNSFAELDKGINCPTSKKNYCKICFLTSIVKLIPTF